MPYVIAEPCINVKDKACVEVCPVDCIYEGTDMLFIHPDECIDCGACEPVCPVKAIFAEDEVPDQWKKFSRQRSDRGRQRRCARRARSRALLLCPCDRAGCSSGRALLRAAARRTCANRADGVWHARCTCRLPCDCHCRPPSLLRLRRRCRRGITEPCPTSNGGSSRRRCIRCVATARTPRASSGYNGPICSASSASSVSRRRRHHRDAGAVSNLR